MCIRDRFYHEVRKIFIEAKERAMTNIRLQYPELDQRLSITELKSDLTKEGDYDAVGYLITQFPK